MRTHPELRRLGTDPFQDMRRWVREPPRPVIFDVGANVGQTINSFRRYFDRPIIHAFEPAPETFAKLREAATGIRDVRLNNVALGQRTKAQEFIENTESVMSSFLALGTDGWGEIRRKYTVQVDTVDNYCGTHSIPLIDILKIDTQGYELEVLRGAHNMMSGGSISLIYLEVIFSEMYKGLPGLEKIYKFIVDRNFELVSFYDFHYQNSRAAWADVLFVNADRRAI